MIIKNSPDFRSGEFKLSCSQLPACSGLRFLFPKLRNPTAERGSRLVVMMVAIVAPIAAVAAKGNRNVRATIIAIGHVGLVINHFGLTVVIGAGSIGTTAKVFAMVAMIAVPIIVVAVVTMVIGFCRGRNQESA